MIRKYSIFATFSARNQVFISTNFNVLRRGVTASATDDTKNENEIEVTEEDGGFRKLHIPGLVQETQKKKRIIRRRDVPPARFNAMKIDQDWTNVWPAASTFKWSAIPFPVRQGISKNMTQNEGVPLEKYANAELMKIPNFLHLTPGHIKKHCAALKEFCTDWPEGLETDKKCEKHFPVEIISSDYLRSASSIRDPRARIVELKIKLSKLRLNYHARDKLIRLVGERYDKKTDTLTLEGNRCPLKMQNEEYVKYLLTALYHEAWKTEKWEADKEEVDWEKYFWDQAASRKQLVQLTKNIKQIAAKTSEEGLPGYIKSLPVDFTEEQLIKSDEVQRYKTATSDLHNEGENIVTLSEYKDSVVKLLHGTSFS
ncbi:small ribosomal subunit protein mS35-like [Tubulanus polymorphus]|uniref:small ribosomal subunit protein mS35-like n=1 Tax=Tubulanus polymorphus TaxID=672921 RepID=UPI003DA417E4